ncbi:MAG: ECF transporter S component [Oscillospiraceae bacterium]|nr:ECF transporter S component [Oscillospiraceae bacterium]
MRNKNTRTLVRFAILTALEAVLAFTSLGYLTIGPFAITFLHIPVIVGAVMMGPLWGASLGLVFGLCTFAKCFGADALGVFLMQISPIKVFLTCVVPRVLMGFFVALIFRALYKIETTRKASYVVASFSGAALNTVLFMSALFLFFGGDGSFLSFIGIEQVTLGAIAALIGLNGVLEMAVCLAFGFALARIVRAVERSTPEDEEAERLGAKKDDAGKSDDTL